MISHARGVNPPRLEARLFDDGLLRMANAPYAPLAASIAPSDIGAPSTAAAAAAADKRGPPAGSGRGPGVARGVHLTNTAVNRALAGGADDALCANPPVETLPTNAPEQ